MWHLRSTWEYMTSNSTKKLNFLSYVHLCLVRYGGVCEKMSDSVLMWHVIIKGLKKTTNATILTGGSVGVGVAYPCTFCFISFSMHCNHFHFYFLIRPSENKHVVRILSFIFTLSLYDYCFTADHFILYESDFLLRCILHLLCLQLPAYYILPCNCSLHDYFGKGFFFSVKV